MKKSTAFGLALLLAVPSVSSVALADGVEEIVEEVAEDIEGEETGEEVEELELIESLSLDMALEQALEGNSSLMLLKYQLEIIENQEGNLNKDFRDAKFDVRDLERTRDKLRNVSGSFQDRLGIQNQLEAFEDVMEQLEKAIEQVKTGKATLAYTDEEAKESIKMATTATYTQLLMSEQQRKFQEKALKTKEKEIAVMKRQLDLGLVSRTNYNKELREIERQKTAIEQSEKEWNKNLAEFALDLGIIYHPDLSLQALKLSKPELLEQETETEELVENSFKYKSQLETISLAEFSRDKVYDDKDSNSYEKNEADLNVKVEKENLTKLKADAEESIRKLYYDVEDGYQAILDAERELKFAQEDYQTLQRRYELGLVSRVNYELAQIQVEQAKLTLDLAKQSYFLLTKQVELLEAGVIQ
ncbi:TolC family protein [bacterium LRH843]|nr:TolC family protein [bacterium LRH843]